MLTLGPVGTQTNLYYKMNISLLTDCIMELPHTIIWTLHFDVEITIAGDSVALLSNDR